MNYDNYTEALNTLLCSYEITATNELIWYSDNPPTEEQVNAAIAAEPMRQLRLERTRLLAQSDWMANSDVTMTTEWQTYRQALRDITTQTPALDENGQLTGITWPTPPNE